MGDVKNNRQKEYFFSDLVQNSADFFPIIADGDDADLRNPEVPEVIPVLPLRNTVLFPGVVIPITVGRQKSLKLVQDVYRGGKLLGTLAQREYNLDDPLPADLYSLGTVAEILKILEMPDGSTTVIIQGKRRFRIRAFVAEDPYFKAQIDVLNDEIPSSNNEFN
ncbi:MAG TPA: LON peptidase substrate-binding domain-containing protein, partial [Prolixibacteraceae bacterium]|nr:LON peptidase substrate-binding domain-containing protein [Prolixibacteraceae bacterium]